VSRIVFSPNILPKEVVDVATSMAPSGFEMVVADFPTPAFMEAVKDAEFFVGFVRGGFDDAFYRNAPKLRLIQLISAGYDRIDIEAARRAKVLVANNGVYRYPSRAWENFVAGQLSTLARL